MALADVVVHVPVHGAWPAHAGYAARFAARHGARLCGVFVLPAPDSLMMPENPQLLANLVAWRDETLARARAAGDEFTAFARALGTQRSEWRVEEGELAERLTHAAAAADFRAGLRGKVQRLNRLAEIIALQSWQIASRHPARQAAGRDDQKCAQQKSRGLSSAASFCPGVCSPPRAPGAYKCRGLKKEGGNLLRGVPPTKSSNQLFTK
jgi:hypothetical protein